MRYLLRRDTIFATAAVFLFIGIISILPINTSLLNPIKIALADFDYSDISYAELHKNAGKPIDKNIVIVNIGEANRAELAMMIEKINAEGPKVIGLDATFKGPKEPEQDELLRLAIAHANNLVTASVLHWEDKENPEKLGYFAEAVKHKGYVNFIGEDRGTIRLFSPFEKIGADTTFAFPTVLVKAYNPERYKTLLERKHPTEIINYNRKENQYFVIEGQDILNGETVSSVFNNKIVLMGYVNPDENFIEDKHFTPFNERFVGKSTPDMNGVLIHANIISMILENNYIHKIPSWLNWLITIIIAWINVAFFVKYFLDSHIWFHLAAKIVQLISFIFFVYLSILFYSRFSVSFDVKVASYAIIFAVDIIYFYEAFAVWLHQKHNIKTIFHKPHH